jgi:cholesterol oxidase
MPEVKGLIRIRKASPITGLASTVAYEGGRLQCTVRYSVANGHPLAAVLLPVVDHDGNWQLQGSSGAIAHPKVADVVVTPGTVQLVGNDRVKLDLPWPGAGAAHALLLLLHPQALKVGDAVWRRRLLLELGLQIRLEEPGLVLDFLDVPQDPTAMKAAILYCLETATASELDLSVFAAPSPAAPPPGASKSRAVAGGERERGASSAVESGAGVGAPVCFALASCLYPAGMIDGTVHKRHAFLDDVDIGPAHRSLWRLVKRLERGERIAGTILTGDQVYVDATAGLFDPKALADGLRVAYDRLAVNPVFTRLLRSGGAVVPMMDDHEIHENWDGPDGANGAELREARAAYLEGQRVLWPWPMPEEGDPLWEEHNLAGFDFFFADTRTERELRTHANWDCARICSDRQAAALRRWIRRVAGPRPAFVVSPAILVPRLLALQDHPAMALHADGWSGFPQSFHELLACLYDASASNVVFLSGDEHLSCLARLSIQERGEKKVVDVYSVHSSAAYAPFVFANSRPEDFADPEVFCFAAGARAFICRVRVISWRPGDGFALLTPMAEPDGRWSLEVRFDRQDGEHAAKVPL